MRLNSLHLNQFGLFRDQEMELAPLTILFGANGAGKSTILDAIEDALILPANRDRKNVESLGRLNIRSAVVYATLDDWRTPGSSDERVMRHVLWMSSNDFEDINEIDLADLDLCPPLEDLLLRKASEMIESGTIGTPDQRILIATHLLENSVLAFGDPQTLTSGRQGDYGSSWGLVCRAPVDEIAIPENAYDKSVLDDFTYGYDDDELLSAVYDLGNGDDAIVTMASRTLLSSAIRPLPMRLEFEPTTLDLELESFVDRIASRLSLDDHPDNKVSWLVASNSPGRMNNSDATDPMNSIVDASTGTSNSLNSADGATNVARAQPKDQTFVLSSLIMNAVERIATHANSIAPKFLLQDSQLEIEIISPTEWKPNVPRIRATINENGRKFPLAFVGSGIARWASYLIRLACQELLAGTIVGDPNPELAITLDDFSYDGTTHFLELPERISYDGATPYEEVAALKILPTQLDVVLLLDEPEAHLHPRAVASIGEWLLDIAPRVASVVVATHHPALFNLRGIGVQKHVTLRSQGTSVVKPWNPASEELVDQLAHQIGLTAGDFFMMSQFVLFVEGPHDLIVLEEFFGDLLRESMVRLVPLHGAKNISLLAESEIVWQMGMPIGVLTDGTNIPRVIRGEHSNHIEKLVERMLRECQAEGRDVEPFGLELDDILFYLDDELTATFASRVFPGWSTAETIWKQIDRPANEPANGTKFKRWITETYGLPLDRDTVREIAKKCKETGKIPKELSDIVSEIVIKTI